MPGGVVAVPQGRDSELQQSHQRNSQAEPCSAPDKTVAAANPQPNTAGHYHRIPNHDVRRPQQIERAAQIAPGAEVAGHGAGRKAVLPAVIGQGAQVGRAGAEIKPQYGESWEGMW